MYEDLKKIIEAAWENRAMLQDETVREAVRAVVELVDKGRLRTAEPADPERSEWRGSTRWSSSTATRSWACAPCPTPWRATAPTSPRGPF